MSYTSSSQGVQTNCASVFMTTLDGILTTAGFTVVETWPRTIVRLASTVNVAALSGLLVVDSVQTVDGDRVLLPAQTTTSQNGIYVVHSGAWTRATDADASGEIYVGLYVAVTAGSSGARVYSVSATGATPWIPGSSSSSWVTSIGTGAVAAVYKSPAASNSFGADWYLSVYRSADTSTTISFAVGEVWDTGTERFRNYAPSAASVPVAVTFAVNDATGLTPASSSLRQIAPTISAAGFQYWISATPNRLTLATRVSGTGYTLYAGLYDDLLTSAMSPFPLMVSTLAASSGLGAGNGSASREPNTTASNTGNFGVNTYYPIGLTSNTASAIYAATYVPGRPLVYSSRISAGVGVGLSAVGARGILKDILYLGIAGAVEGDTLAVTDAVGAVKNYTLLSTSGYWVDQGV